MLKMLLGLVVADFPSRVGIAHPHPTGGEDGCILEVFNAVGETIAVVTVPLSAVEPLRADEILTVRSLAQIS
jgi:hypothetical protein